MNSPPDFETRDAPTPGAIVAGKYRVDGVLGQGGMGVVVRATHLQLGEAVALKFLHGDAARSAAHVERFLREARAAVRIKSEHVTRVHDVGTLQGGEPFMVMELLEGHDLQRVARERGLLPIAEAVEYVVQACRGAAEAHAQGIVHRDLKPANLFLTRRSNGTPLVKILDFGISKVADASDQNLTGTADILGSPLYMSPEQIRDARRVDGRADIWALGNILFKLLTGHAPFAASSSAATLAAIVADPAPSLRAARPDVSPELEAVVLRCLDKQPDRRFQSADELAAALTAALTQATTGAHVEPTLQARPPAPRDLGETTAKGAISVDRPPARVSPVALSVSVVAVLLAVAAGLVGLAASRKGSDAGVVAAASSATADSVATAVPASSASASSSPPSDDRSSGPPPSPPTPTASASASTAPAPAVRRPAAPRTDAPPPARAPATKKPSGGPLIRDYP
jgi:serine/threonine-protein kinase